MQLEIASSETLRIFIAEYIIIIVFGFELPLLYMYLLDVDNKYNLVTVAEDRNKKKKLRDSKRMCYYCSSVVVFNTRPFLDRAFYFLFMAF